MNRNFRAVFFDFGGTLYSYRSKGLSMRPVLEELLGRLGVSVDSSRVRSAFERASRGAYQEFAPRDFYLHRELFMDTYRRFAIEIAKAEPHSDLLTWCHEEQCRRVIENFVLREDCLGTLRALRGKGLHVSIVSNIDDDYLLPMVERHELSLNLDAWTSSEEARSCKPHEGIFRLALAKAGCAANETLFVGDSLEADVAGAQRQGMTSVYLCERGERAPSPEGLRPDFVAESLSDVSAALGI